MNPFQLLIATLIVAAVFEAVTLFFRFGLGMQSTRDTKWLARWTRGLRIHHGYVGAAALGPFLLAPINPVAGDVGVIVAGALILSDLAHHFLVLWPLTGSPQFDLSYDRPDAPEAPAPPDPVR
jgi:hypothetical protein